MAKAKKKAKSKVMLKRVKSASLADMRREMATSRNQLNEMREAYQPVKRENMILRLQNNALMEVLRNHARQVEELIGQLTSVNRQMLAHAKQNQAEGVLRAISEKLDPGSADLHT